MDATTIARNLRTYRQARGWTQQELASRATTCPGTIYRLERGLPSHANTIRRVARALGVKLRALEVPTFEGAGVPTSGGRGDSSSA